MARTNTSTGGGGGVTSLNGLAGSVNLLEGAGIDITTAGQDIIIAAIGANVPSDTRVDVKVATTAVLPGSPTYDNGTAGVGATLTRSSNGTTGTIDGVTAANLMAGDYILVKNEANQITRGVYEVTQQGTASLPYILTRVAEADTTEELDDLVVIPAQGGQKGIPFGQQTSNPIIGTSNIVFTATGIYMRQQTSGTQVAGQIPYYTGTALTLTKGDPLFTRDITSKVTLIATDIELVEPTITSTAGLFTGVFAETFIGSGAIVAENTDDTHFALSLATVGADGKPKGGILGGVQGAGAQIGTIEAGLNDDTLGTPYFSMIAQITGGGIFRTLIKGDENGLRLKTDDLFVLDSSRGEIRLRQTSSSTDWWEIPVVAGTDGYVLTAHGDGAEATWEAPTASASLTSTYVGYGDGSNVLTGSSNFTYDGSTLSVGDGTSSFTTDGATSAIFDLQSESAIFRVSLGTVDELKLDFSNGQYQFGRYADTLPGLYISGDNINLLAPNGSAGLSATTSSGYTAIGDVNDYDNGTKITVDDVNQLITISNVPTYADDAAAATGGLTTGQLYKTTTGGITSLNIVP